MMNFLALGLVASSLAIAGVWSPIPEKPQIQKEHVIVREEHRVTVVEYDQDGQVNTKASISPQQHVDQENHQNLQGLLHQPKSNGETHSPKELICDALGKCTHKIASAIGKAKDKVAETTHKVVDQEKKIAYEAVSLKEEVAHEAKEAVEDAYERVKDTATQKAHDVKESAIKKAQDVKGSAKESMEIAKDKLKTAKDTGKTIGEDLVRNVSEQIDNRKESTKHAVGKLKIGARKFIDGFGHFADNTVRYVGSALSDLMSVMNLLGFATAYGMCLWVTFISSYVLAGALPRQQFGVLQTKIYPVYFRAMAYGIGLALLGHLLGQRKKMLTNKAEMFQGYNLMASILMVFANMLFLEPRATKVMFERMKIEKEEGRGRESYEAESIRGTEPQPVTGPAATTTTTTATTETPSPAPESSEQEVVRSRIVRLSDRLKELNSYSSFLNILTLMALTWHLVYLGQRLHLTC